jgi:hypothetical protein
MEHRLLDKATTRQDEVASQPDKCATRDKYSSGGKRGRENGERFFSFPCLRSPFSFLSCRVAASPRVGTPMTDAGRRRMLITPGERSVTRGQGHAACIPARVADGTETATDGSARNIAITSYKDCAPRGLSITAPCPGLRALRALTRGYQHGFPSGSDFIRSL